MVGLLLTILLFIASPAWAAWTETIALDPVPGATAYRLEKTLDNGLTWIVAAPDSATPIFTYTGNETGLVLFRVSALNASAVTTRTYSGVWHNASWSVIPPIPPPTGTTTVTFDSPILSGSNGSPVNGIYQGIDFGSSQWRWSGPTGPFTTRSIYFSSSTGTSRSFIFSPVAKILINFKMVTQIPGTVTIIDNLGQVKTQSVTSGPIVTITTGWAQPSTTVTITFNQGWVFNLDDIVYK